MALGNLITFGQRLDYLLGEMSNAEFERLTGISNELIGRYRKDKGNPTLDKLDLLKKYFKDDYYWLITGEGNSDGEKKFSDKDVKYLGTKFKNVPVIGAVPCGIPAAQWETDEEKIMKLADVGHFHSPFILTAKGDSMSPYINNKDLLLCADEPQRIKKGKAVVVSFKTEPDTIVANAKLIKFPSKREIMLYSINTKYEPEIYDIKDIYKIYKVVRIIRDVN